MELTAQWLIPPGISPFFTIVLIGASFLTSALTAALGLGGGVALLAIMGVGMPAASLLPVHGIVQFGSNFGRAVVQRQDVVWSTVVWFIVGSLVGIVSGGLLVSHIPDNVARLALAAFILWSVYGARPVVHEAGRPALVTGGVISSFGTMILGATGPIVAAFLAAQGLQKKRLIATHATCMMAQHGCKILMFGALGFAYAQWMPLMTLMIIAGVLGTIVGTKTLDNLSDRFFRRCFTFVMTVLALQIIWQALKLNTLRIPL